MRHVLIAILAGTLAMAAWARPAASTSAPASSASKPSEPLTVLLEKGIYQEETAGDLDAAMTIYNQIIAQSAANRQAVAQAHYRLGMCLLKKGDKDRAAQQFDQLVAHFSDQKEILAKARAELAKMPKASNQPHVVKTTPPALADDVDPALDKITVTFDQPMMDKSWSWTGGDKAFSEQTGTLFPERAGEITYDQARTTCTLPVKLQPGKVYWVGINSPSYQNFQTAAHVPAMRHVILFATRSADGKPGLIPEKMLLEAGGINAITARRLERIVDKIDYPFVDDPSVIGRWESVDFTPEIQNFKPGVRQFPGDLFLKELVFENGGKTDKPWWTWTKGLVLHRDDKTASKYEIKEIDGTPYLFFEWKSGDYSLMHMKPQYYVLKKASANGQAATQDAKQAEAAKAAVPVAQEWLKFVDDGKYAESWGAAAEFFRKAVSNDTWQQQLKAFRSPLGKVQERKVLSAVFTTSLPGAPDGQYVVVQFHTDFENKKDAVETVTPMKDTDGQWRVSGYFIK